MRMEGNQSPLFQWPFFGLLYLPWKIIDNDSGEISGMSYWNVKPMYWEKTCPQ
jgi:hypothetical protein